MRVELHALKRRDTAREWAAGAAVRNAQSGERRDGRLRSSRHGFGVPARDQLGDPLGLSEGHIDHEQQLTLLDPVLKLRQPRVGHRRARQACHPQAEHGSEQ